MVEKRVSYKFQIKTLNIISHSKKSFNWCSAKSF